MRVLIVFTVFCCFGTGLFKDNAISVAGLNLGVKAKLRPRNTIFTVPGTKWCGRGNTAEDIDDLGINSKTDACCRNHDLCPDVIKSGETKHGIYNSEIYTLSHCDCDDQLYACLEDVGSVVTKTIFFSILQPKCFKEMHPITQCLKKHYHTFDILHLGKYRCLEYEVDESKPTVMQLVDNPHLLR